MIFNKIEENIKQNITQKPKIVLGLSGGPDSVFLFHFLKKLHNENKITLIAAHLDHGWRKESEKDAKFCEQLCKQHGIEFISEHTNNLCLNSKFNGSKEEMGRNLRRIFLENILKDQNANLIALAHHLQDQQETFFWRIIRGCSLTGLTCMKQIDLPYLRPLLNINKQEILDYLHKNKIEYLQDETNSSEAYLRNRIRKYVLPAMQKSDSRFDSKFKSTLQHLQEEEIFLKNLTEEAFQKVFAEHGTKTSGNLLEFLKQNNVLQKRLIIYWLCKQKAVFNSSESYLQEILRFFKNGRGGCHQLGNNWELCKKKNSFWINKIQNH